MVAIRNRTIEYARTGDGAVLAPQAASLERLGADSSWFCRWPATQDRGILPAGSGNVGPSAFRSINSLRPDVVLLERRGGAVAIAARRVAAGRVVQLGDEDTWQGRMTGGERCRFHFTRVSVSCHACKSGPR